MDRKSMFKFIFVLIVGILIIGMSVYGFLGDEDKENYENMFDDKIVEDSNTTIDDDLLDEIKQEIENEKDQINEVKNEEGKEREDDHSVSNENHEIYDTINEKFDYEKIYVDQFGEQALDHTLTVTEKLVKNYLNKEENLKGWSDNVTPTFLKGLKNHLPEKKAEKINSLEVFATEQINKNEITIGCIANYDSKTSLLNIVFVEVDGQFLADNIVSMWNR